MARKANRRQARRSSNKAPPELPQPIIHRILSFLPNKESTKTSVLSKAWLSAWRTRPKLEFEPRVYFSRELKQDASWGRGGESKYEKFWVFYQYIKTTLKRYRLLNITIDTMTFKIERMFDPGWNPLVEKCANFAVKNGVRNLDFSLPECDLPSIVFRAESLVDLSVAFCNIIKLSVREIRCHGLKRLCLKCVALDVKMFTDIIARCPLIEVLEIWYIEGFDDFKVTKVNHLKELIIRLLDEQRVKIDAPNLEMLTCINEEFHWLDDDYLMPCYITLCGSRYQNLKSLLFNGVGIDDGFFSNLAYKFPNLEDLKVKNCQELERIKISSKSLKKLRLVTNRGLVEAQIDVPGIVDFEYHGDRDLIPELYFSATSSRWASYIWIYQRDGIDRRDIDSSWFFKLNELLARLNQSEISLYINLSCNVAFDFVEIRDQVSFHEPHVVQELSLDMCWDFSLSKGHSVLDGIFWVCRPKVMKYPVYIHCDNEAAKFLYEMLIFTRQDQLHDLQQINFWQRDLKKVKVAVSELEDLDWDNILNVIENNDSMEPMVCFELEWGEVLPLKLA